MAPPRARSFTTAATTAPTAEGVPAQAPAPVVPMSDIPSKEARNIGHTEGGEDYSLDGLIADRPDPDMDLVTKSYAIPRYLAEALRLHHVKTRRPHQAIVADALRATLPPALVEACRRRAERG